MEGFVRMNLRLRLCAEDVSQRSHRRVAAVSVRLRSHDGDVNYGGSAHVPRVSIGALARRPWVSPWPHRVQCA